jgi:hypothetical protein
VNEAHKKCCDSQVAAIIEERQKPRIEATERADAKDDVQKKECTGTCAANDEGLRRCSRVKHRAESDKDSKIENNAAEKHEIIGALLGVPADGCVLMAHRVTRSLAEIGLGGTCISRADEFRFREDTFSGNR